VHVADYNRFEILGQTRDDAAGEAFDKIARAIGLGYPGGPLIDRAAAMGNPTAMQFPRVRFNDGCYDFSFSGVKTAVLNYINSAEQKGEGFNVNDVAASFQKAVVDVLVSNTINAAGVKKVGKIALAGGVAANSLLRSQMKETGEKIGLQVYFPRPILCTDNAAMIACSAYYALREGFVSGLSLNAVPGLRLGEKQTCG
jgi:N6-L-threonylcarbamoyladenine synthase